MPRSPKAYGICGPCVIFAIATGVLQVNADAFSTNIVQQSLDIVGRGFLLSAVAVALEKLLSSPSAGCHHNLCVRVKLGFDVFLTGKSGHDVRPSSLKTAADMEARITCVMSLTRLVGQDVVLAVYRCNHANMGM
jgi:hypothetical protein